MTSTGSIIARAEELYYDRELSNVREWKAAHAQARAIGFLPIYVPRELIHAAGMLPVGIMGGGDRLEIVKGDAYFQSYRYQVIREQAGTFADAIKLA